MCHLSLVIFNYNFFYRQLTAGPGASATSQQNMNATPFVSIPEAEKQTAAYLAEQKPRNQLPTPGKIYNWDG